MLENNVMALPLDSQGRREFLIIIVLKTDAFFFTGSETTLSLSAS
jgi:hypothetical protein